MPCIADFSVCMQTPADNPGTTAPSSADSWHSFSVTHQFAVVVNGLEMVAIIALLGSSWNTARFDTAYALL